MNLTKPQQLTPEHPDKYKQEGKKERKRKKNKE